MILPLTLLLAFQLIGEVIARAAHLTVPGPVIGMALLLAAMMALPRLAETIRTAAQGLLSHLSLLFVPAGVGIVGHLGRLGEHALGIAAALIVSTALAIAVSALVFVGLARAMGAADD